MTNQQQQPICPRCGQSYTGYPATSRRDNRTAICSVCGTQEAVEALQQWQYAQPTPQQVQPPQPKRKARRGCLFVTIGFLLIVALLIIGIALTGKSTPSAESTPTTTTQSKPAYKASTTNTTVAKLDKNGSAGKGTDVHFTCTISNFVKNDAGMTAGANVTDPQTHVSIQVGFPEGTDVTRLNTGDTLEVWGNDQGAMSGQNAFGATIQEVVVQASYLTDQTTGYTH